MKSVIKIQLLGFFSFGTEGYMRQHSRRWASHQCQLLGFLALEPKAICDSIAEGSVTITQLLGFFSFGTEGYMPQHSRRKGN